MSDHHEQPEQPERANHPGVPSEAMPPATAAPAERIPEVSLIVPTRNRPGRLHETLAAIDATLQAHGASHRCEVVVIDDASVRGALSSLPATLPGGTPVRFGRRETSIGAACRNDAAAMARAPWLLMLDDDSWPMDAGFLDIAAHAAGDMAVIGLDIRLRGGDREAGGLPEVHVGCGALIRTAAFRAVGGYDASFHYYVEEYDLAARLIAAGWRLRHDVRSTVMHEKVAGGRSMDLILERLVRNNGWVIRRYAPTAHHDTELAAMLARYERIAEIESAGAGYRRGRMMLEATIDAQPRRTMDEAMWARFTGEAALHAGVLAVTAARPAGRWTMHGAGKGADRIRAAMTAAGWTETDAVGAELHVPGSLSPGPMLDVADQLDRAGRDVILPWTPRGTRLGLPRRHPVRAAG
jgi:hypothetical protein